MEAFDTARIQTVQLGHVNPTVLLDAAAALATATPAAVRPRATQLVTAMQQATHAGRAVPWGQAIAMLAAGDATVLAQRRDPTTALEALGRDLSGLHDTFADLGDDADLTRLLRALRPLNPGDPLVQPVAVDALATGVTAAFDPSSDAAPAATRVLATIAGGVDPDQPLAPPEPCVGLDRPAWADLAEAFGDWLLPGVGQLSDNCVVPLATNPVFIDAYLAGLNTQLLGELRWRNLPIASGCTPIRRFWDRADTATGEPGHDIIGIASWTNASLLGDPSHRAPGASGRELVIAVRGELLLRYPTTLVYLQPAARSGPSPDFDKDPEDTAVRVLPGFRGRVGADVVFFGFPTVADTALADHWLVLEEPPAGYRFANDTPTAATTGHDWAVATLARPVRVLIPGDTLQGGNP
jgi:hypothetical protein